MANRKIVVLAAALFAVAMLVVGTSSALAEIVKTDSEFGGGTSVVDVAGHTRVRFTVFGNMRGDYYSGRADRIHLAVDTGTINPSTGLPVWKNVAGYEDNAVRSAFSVSLGLGTTENVVKTWQIGVMKIDKTIIVYWTIPLVCPATGAPNPTPEVVVPPGLLVLAGSGDLIYVPATTPVPFGTTGWKVAFEFNYYNAEATFLCPGWHYCGPVGEAFAGTSQGARAVTDRIWVWTKA
jgi:hypothetical protein